MMGATEGISEEDEGEAGKREFRKAQLKTE